MNNVMPHTFTVSNYFVDEAGNGELFDKKGRVIIGTEGCSRFFMMGLLDVPNPGKLTQDIEKLRMRLLNDPYFKGVPSMQPQERKTALFFHAKDDVPEVRREMFTLLQRHSLRFYAVVRDKSAVMQYVRQRNVEEPTYRYKPNELYNDLVNRMFNGLLHKHDVYNVCFARRVKADQTAALQAALRNVQGRFNNKRASAEAAELNITTPLSHERAELQAADYFLWSLQRLYERREDRYIELLWPGFRLVHDVDDTREAHTGMEYTQKRPLLPAALKDLPGI